MKTINLKENPKQKRPENFTGKVIFENGDIGYSKKGFWHREDGLPAVELSDGSKAYWVEGKLHRIGGPAVEGYSYKGDNEYWVYGELVSKEAHDLLVLMLKLKETTK